MCSAKILLMIELRSSQSSAMGSQRVRILICKDYRVHTMLEMSNLLQREPQRADLNMRRELISCPPCPVFICRVGACGFISRQSALIVWHNAFNFSESLLTCSVVYFQTCVDPQNHLVMLINTIPDLHVEIKLTSGLAKVNHSECQEPQASVCGNLCIAS